MKSLRDMKLGVSLTDAIEAGEPIEYSTRLCSSSMPARDGSCTSGCSGRHPSDCYSARSKAVFRRSEGLFRQLLEECAGFSKPRPLPPTQIARHRRLLS